jgi:DNA repair exonuclease SbcCD ATPase subunit
MREVNALPRSGKPEDAEKILESLLTKPDRAAICVEPASAAMSITMVTCRKLVHDLSSAFLVFIDKVQAELRVTKEQKEQLDRYLSELLPDATRMLPKSKEWGPEERKTYNQKTHEEIASVLKEILSEGQLSRLSQLERQREGLFGGDFYWKDLEITDEQREQFKQEIQGTEKTIQKLLTEIHNTAEADKIRPKVLQCRKELEDKLEALLTDAQKKQWKEMLGVPVEPDALYELSSQ